MSSSETPRDGAGTGDGRGASVPGSARDPVPGDLPPLRVVEGADGTPLRNEYAARLSEVEDRLGDSALGMSGGQQQRLCIARAIANRPDVLLMDEPCSALDPIATLRIEDLMRELKDDYTIVIVTHNMQQAARVSDYTAFLTVDIDDTTGQRTGELVELDRTEAIFTNASDPRTEGYISGRFG